MDYIPFLVQVQSFVAWNSNGFACSIILLEEVNSIATSYDASSLVLEKKCGCSLQLCRSSQFDSIYCLRGVTYDCCIVAMALESDASEQSTQ